AVDRVTNTVTLSGGRRFSHGSSPSANPLLVDDTGKSTPVVGVVRGDSISGLATTLNGGSARGNDTRVVQISGADDGRFTLTLNGHTTVPLNWNAAAPSVQAALAALPGVGAGNVVVDQVGNAYVVSLQGTLAGQPGWALGALTANGSGLIPPTGGPAPTATVSQISDGRIDYSAFGTVGINLGSGGNTVVAESTQTGATTTLNSGAGSDRLVVHAATGPTHVNGQAGDDT